MYTQIPRDQIPVDVRWDTPTRNQGQAVEVSYAHQGTRATPADLGDRYRRIVDTSLPVSDPERVTFYRLTQRGAS